jgi:tetratricopeptide (TPR) repeat protein
MRKTARFTALTVMLVSGLCASAAGELETAREALRDGLWSIAREHAARNGGEEARRLILESYAREGDWQGLSRTLSGWTNAVGKVYDYYRAAAAGDYFKALKILKETPAALADADSRMFEADMLLKSGDRPGAEKIWREVVAMTNAGERAFAVAGANLGDIDALRLAYSKASRASVRRLAGLKLGVLLLKDAASRESGEKLVRAIVKDAPDGEGARDAFLAIAEVAAAQGRWKEAFEIYHEAVETWPDCAKLVQVQEGRAWACLKLGKLEDALSAFKRTEELAQDAERKAAAVLKQGDVYSEMGKGGTAMARYRDVLERFPETAVAEKLRKVVRVRELESKGREQYRNFRFAEAKQTFAAVAAEDPAKRPRMEFYEALCLYGQGLDDEAGAKISEVARKSPDMAVRAEAALWAAKFLYNRGEWKEAFRMFSDYALMGVNGAAVPEAMLWAARSAFAAGDFQNAVKTATALAELYPSAPQTMLALIVQGEALIELARFDEAVLVLDRAAHFENSPMEERLRARMLRADALFATGADNPARYVAALDSYRAIRLGGTLSGGDKILVSFKIAKSLEKLKRTDEAIDEYYTQVVLAYRTLRGRGERIDDDARAAFSRAAFRLADEYESRGRDYQAIHVLELVATSDVPAAGEAGKRIERISMKGGFL